MVGRKVQRRSTWETFPVMRERMYVAAVVAMHNLSGYTTSGSRASGRCGAGDMVMKVKGKMKSRRHHAVDRPFEVRIGAE